MCSRICIHIGSLVSAWKTGAAAAAASELPIPLHMSMGPPLGDWQWRWAHFWSMRRTCTARWLGHLLHCTLIIWHKEKTFRRSAGSWKSFLKYLLFDMGMQYFQDPPRARSYSHNAYYLARGQHLRDLPRAGSHFCNTCYFTWGCGISKIH
ncbi:uncharacterized protein LOC125510314 isoform X2 [Triticum urartu]|uniref:uncharacterized protein LOC125510314 isoform X2 n=1 Tax=Triticum urartu TaxID=4572 RepID=UPI002044571F|nr:uncharacterized protein LOC125510314 isoform X2 [Triticum urartu]